MVTGENDQSVTAEQRLKELGIKLPVPSEPFGTYVEAVQTGNLLFLTGMLPTAGREAKFVGRVGAELDVKAGRESAHLAALNALAVARNPPRLTRQNHADRTSRSNDRYERRCSRPAENRRCCIGVIPKRFWKGEKSVQISVWRRKPAAGHTGGAGNHFRGGAVMQVSHRALMVSAVLASLHLSGQGKELPMEHPTLYRTTQIDGLSIFYREAGPKNAPTILFLHGL